MTTPLMTIVAGVIMNGEKTNLQAVQGPTYIRLAFKTRLSAKSPENLCFIRPIEGGVKVEFKMTPIDDMTALVNKERTIEIVMGKADSCMLCVKEGRRTTVHSLKNSKSESDLVSLALYRHNLVMVRKE